MPPPDFSTETSVSVLRFLFVGPNGVRAFMQFFVIGTRNGGAEPVGHLLNVTFPGPAWANGGALGTEASYFMLPVIALLFVYILLRYRDTSAILS